MGWSSKKNRRRRKARPDSRPAKPKPRRNRRRDERRRLRRTVLGDGCTGKRKLVSKDEAIAIAGEIFARKPERRELGVYLCEVCSHLHLTSKPGATCCMVIENLCATGGTE